MQRRRFLLGGAALLLGCRQRAAADGSPDVAVRSLVAESTAENSVAAVAEVVQAAPILGINSHLLLDEDLRLIKSLGISHVRSTLVSQLWTDVPSYSVSVAENTARAESYGVRVLYVVHNTHGEVFRMGNDP